MTYRHWRLAQGRRLALGRQALVMGVLNVTPDSFSDGGLFDAPDRAVAQAKRMVAEGAVIVDVGGESTRPGAQPISATDEQARVLPVIERLAREEQEAILSVDTYREETARLAIAAGAHIVNDVWGLQREPDIAQVVAKTGAGVVIMHTSRAREKLPDVIADQVGFLSRSLEIARQAGVADDQIVLDPGFGFGKEREENLEIMARFTELKALGFPLLVGTSRKRFIGYVTGRDALDRDAGTAATNAILRLMGADVFRVHDVASNIDALKIADATLAARKTAESV